MRRSFTTVGIVIALLVGLAVSATPASATPGSVAQASALETANSATSTLPFAGKQGSKRAGACGYEYLCVWQHAYYGGGKRSYYYCGFHALLWDTWPGTLLFVAHSISSIVNNQTWGTVSVFFERSLPAGGDFLEQVAYGYRDDLSVDGFNDTATEILVC